MKKVLPDFIKEMEKCKIPCFIFLLTDNKNKPKFIEVIVKRPYRYTQPELLKKIPKNWRGIKVKVV